METGISLARQYPKDRYTLLIATETVARIPEIQSPVINTVKISTSLADKEIYVQEKAKEAYTDKGGNYHPASPALYALTKRGLTKLAEAAGIKQVESVPVLPSTCQKCAGVNRQSGKAMPCGQCPNKDVKYKVTISVPQLTGETLYFVDHHEINVENVTAAMTTKQKAEFLKHLAQICEAKALNGAIRTALQIKGTYTLEELQKPFVVAYLVPNLDNPDVKRAAIESMFSSARGLFGMRQQKPAEVAGKGGGMEPDGYLDVEYKEPDAGGGMGSPAPCPGGMAAEDRTRDFCCDKCGEIIPEKVWNYSYGHFGQPLCYKCQRAAKQGQKEGTGKWGKY